MGKRLLDTAEEIHTALLKGWLEHIRDDSLANLNDVEEYLGLDDPDNFWYKRYHRMGVAGKKNFLEDEIERFADACEEGYHVWMDDFRELLFEREQINKTEFWDVYAVTRNRVKQDIKINIMDFFGNIKVWEWQVAVYALGKSGLALRTGNSYNDSSEWFYLLPHMPSGHPSSF